MARQLLFAALGAQGRPCEVPLLALPGFALRQSLRADLGVDVSISHSQNWIGVCLAPGVVGLDLEAPGRRRKWRAIAEAFFTPYEAQQLALTRADQREALFLRYWTLKEAFIKAVGGGVFDGLNQLRVVADDRIELAAINPQPMSLQSAWCASYGDLILGVCSSGRGRLARPHFWHCSDLQEFIVQPCAAELILTEQQIGVGREVASGH